MPDLPTVRAVAVAEIVPDPDQPRRDFDPDELKALAGSLRSQGQLQPVKVRWAGKSGKWLLVYGERRWRAAQLAGLPTLDCIIAEGMDEETVRAQQLTENLHRADLSPLERAQAYRALMDLRGWNAGELAKVLNVHHGTVSRALAVLKQPGAGVPNRQRGKPVARVFELPAAKITVQGKRPLDAAGVRAAVRELLGRLERRAKGGKGDVLSFDEGKKDAV